MWIGRETVLAVEATSGGTILNTGEALRMGTGKQRNSTEVRRGETRLPPQAPARQNLGGSQSGYRGESARDFGNRGVGARGAAVVGMGGDRGF